MKTAKKGLCLFLALVLCLGLFAACSGSDGGSSYIGGNGGDDTPPRSGGMLAGIDAKELMIEMDGTPILWEEVFYDLQSVRRMLEGQSPVEDWDDIFRDQTFFPGEVTFNEFAVLFAIDAAIGRRAMEVLFTDKLGERLEDGLYEEVRQEIMFGQNLDEDTFHLFLESYSLTEDVFRYFNESMAMHARAMEIIAGVEGERVSDESVAVFVETEEILRAKHILVSVLDENRDPLSEAEQAAANTRAYALFEELDTLSGDEQTARFEEMLAAYGEDPGMEANPEGYTFAPGAMVVEFTEGTMALGLHEIGPPVRSNFGYHIIFRLPVERTAILAMPGSGQPAPIQLLAAGAELERRLEEIREDLHYTIMPRLDTIVPSEIFALAELAAFGPAD